jgi:hypothetical protein
MYSSSCFIYKCLSTLFKRRAVDELFLVL